MEFNINLEDAKKKVLEDVRRSTPGTEAIKKLRVVREKMDWAIEGYRNSLTILSDTTYEDRKHFLMELIQNADDAEYGDQIPEIHFYITDEGLELFYNETGFTVEDIISITDTGASTKKTKKNNASSFIGEKGIGFKSVFALAETVEIQSGPWHFILGKDQCIVPIAVEGSEAISGTRQVIRFTDPHVTEEIHKELQRYISGEAETFIYLQKISKFLLIDKREGSYEENGVEIIPADRRGDRLTLRLLSTGEEREFLLYSENVHFSQELVSSRWEKIGNSLGSVDRKVVLAAAMSETKLEEQGRLFCYLPTSVSLPIPVYMQVDGVTKADRERLHDPQNNPWNVHLLEELPSIIARAITHWSKTVDSVEKLYRLIPTMDGNDQLQQVFGKARKVLRDQPWVRVLGEESFWRKPDYIMGFPDYLNNLFLEYPFLVEEFDNYLKKYILHPEWYSHPQLRKKLGSYGVTMATDSKILSALTDIGLPSELLRDKEKLLSLYEFIIELLDNKHAVVKNPGESYMERKIDSIRTLKIFPLEGKGFSDVSADEGIYYVLREDKSILSGNALLIDRSYLKNTKYSEEEFEALSEDEKLDMRLSETLLSLLKKLGIQELSDEIVLSDFIVPDLKSTAMFTPEDRFKKFFALFDYYKNKITSPRFSKKLFEGMDDVWLYGQDGHPHQLKNLLIPTFVRISATESIYDHFGLQEILILPHYRTRIEEDRVLFHDFLLECGIRHKPIFHFKKEEYKDVVIFRREDRARYDLWRQRIKNDYTSSNRVTVERVELDEVDRKILSQGEVTKEYERYLYSLWLENFKKNEINDYSYYYKGTAFPGYFLVKYMRNEKRCVQIKENDWSGVDKSEIPLIKSDGKIVRSSDAFILPILKDKRLHYLYDYLNGVHREEAHYPQLSYESLYLETLEVPHITYHHLDVLWKDISENRHEDIIDFISHLIDLNIAHDEIRILNKNTGRMINLSRFKLGKISLNEEPLIEEQYGEAGKKLGERYGLTKGGTIESYKGFVLAMVQDTVCSDATLKGFMSLIQEWGGYKANEKMTIIEEFSSMVEDKITPILVLGDVDLHQTFERNHIRSILIPEELIKSDKSLLYKAAGEIGFILPDSFGNLQINEKEVLSSGFYEKSEQVLQSYVELFEKKEIARLDSKLKLFGGINKVLSHVILGTSAYREEKGSGISYEVKLPYVYSSEKKIVLKKTSNEYEIIMYVLLMVEFAPKRNIERDLLEIKRAIEREQRAYENSAREAQKSDESEKHENSKNGADDFNGYTEQEVVKDKERNDFRDKTAKKEDIAVIQNVNTLVSTMKDKLAGSASSSEEKGLANWRLGPDPDEEEKIRETLVEKIASSLEEGPEVYKKKLSIIKKKRKVYKGKELDEDEKLIDRDSIEPKAFLEAEYDCRCQVCGNQIIFDSGKKWISVYHIQERKEGAWFYDRPFNILGLCPNCYTMAKYSGNRDFSKLLDEAQKVLEGDTFAESVDSFGGDYYLVDVVLDNKDYQMKMSKVHMNYFAALVELDEDEEKLV
ncbi:sacsin N-terminal ATP-binding-like domain-containing protein [Proteiniclasticum ruminis]|uniref:Histidine kinase-, DNA gyrase B-, and HSP90-like ATPase n=1 Tax=Proteiniclasticum ruminis TaxID=398199 RepID=A0A1I5AFM7_9CLOT|nr:hypothetical protein [Proteiniclasticum ruminis]SFN61296.1 hypothetical protein SAMN04488695_1034 [Proteiniclasticum ruminis]